MTIDTSQRIIQSKSFFNDLIEKRRKLVDALEANKGEVNLDIFEDFYPDRAHFVYELLQNAEDAGATQVTFTLKQDCLVCEHDGRRTFTEADVTAITGIHNSTKDKAQDRIGKFGVGFKSVFVYTQSPTVRSGDFSFRIVDMILPEPVAPDPVLGTRTRFEFPFDNPKKLPEEAYAEIAAGLNDLDETTLLFLSNLRAINWQIGDSYLGEVLSHRHSDSHFEISKHGGGRTTSSHYLKFDQTVLGLGAHTVAVAFPLDFLAGVREFDKRIPLAEQLKIIPAPQGRVAVFFVAAKETSGLLFHLHGPFVPELSRASIKDTPTNEPLFSQLSGLCAQSLHKIRDLGLLSTEFLAILPNPEDQIPLRYQLIRSAIIDEMKSHALTPTYERGHAAANRLIQAKASLKSLLSNVDMEFLVEHEDDPPLWAMAVTQKNSRIDNFLSGLEIQEWGIEKLVKTLETNAHDGRRYISDPPYFVTGPDDDFMQWFAQKTPEWLQQLYALLHDDADQPGLMQKLKSLRFVRLTGGAFGTAAKCFFASDDTDEAISTVDTLVYTSGKTKTQQEKAKQFLSNLGVRELGEAEEIELILNTRYTKEAQIPDEKTYLRDLKRFIALTEQQPEKAKLFASFYIFKGADDNWYTPDSIYLDQPYQLTDLSAYYQRFEENAECVALNVCYQNFRIAMRRVNLFAEVVGVRVELKITKGTCRNNPQWVHLRSVGGDRNTSPCDIDFFIPQLPEFLKTPSLELSRLLWRTLGSLDASYLKATFRRSYVGGTHHADSRLVHDLQGASWIPQGDGVFVRPADASQELLPGGFPFDHDCPWVKAMEFGGTATHQSEQAVQKEAAAKSLGFSDAAAAERAKRFNDFPMAEQEKILSELASRDKPAVPDRELANPERRAQGIREQALKAPDKESEIRERSVSIGREDVKTQADAYLREHYRNADGEVTCQICKGPLPFKLDDGREYFEVVELLPELRKRHPQNYVALCPNHSAMFRLVNGTRDSMREAFCALEGNELPVLLSDQELTLYFNKTHILDLRAVLDAEGNLLLDDGAAVKSIGFSS